MTAPNLPSNKVDVHVVNPTGTVRRLQVNKNRSFPMLDVTLAGRNGKIVGIASVDLTNKYRKAGWTLLKEDFEEDGNPEGYEAYCRWEAFADSISRQPAHARVARIPDVSEHLPTSVLLRRQEASDKRDETDFGFPAKAG
jgi:hypothetical protein